MRSIRVFLTFSLLAIVTLVNFAAAMRGYQSAMDEAEELLDRHLAQQFDLLDLSLPPLTGTDSPTQVLSNAGGSGLEFQWLAPDGALLARSKGSPDTAIAMPGDSMDSANFAGHRWHLLMAERAGRQGWIILAERDSERFRVAESVIVPAVLPMVLAVPVLGLVIWSVLGLGLRPVWRLAQDLGQREATDLRPLATDELPNELQRVARSANSLLRRLEAAFEREKRFAADAAHELRSPIAALRIQCENLAQSAPEHGDQAAKLLTGVERMQHLVDQILLLSRLAPDQLGGVRARFRPVDLAELARRLIAEQSALLQHKSLDITVEGEVAWVNGDPEALAAMLRNLLDNALKYSPEGGQVRVSLRLEGDQQVLSVRDSGPGIPAELRERVFDRFYRVGGDRHPSGVSGCGLGLSIVRHALDLHQGRIRFSDPLDGPGLLVEVRLSAAAAEQRQGNNDAV